MELNREQIIKALECCITIGGCDNCPFYNKASCGYNLRRDALSLIKELTEENQAWQKQLISTGEQAGKAYYELACEVEDLRAENERLHASCTELERKCASLNDKNERLRGVKSEYETFIGKLKPKIDTIKANERADTVRKMQARLIAEFRKDDRMNYYLRKTLDQIAKEMLEGAE